MSVQINKSIDYTNVRLYALKITITEIKMGGVASNWVSIDWARGEI